MTIHLSDKDKTQTIHLLEKLLQSFVYPGVSPQDRAALSQHISWLHAQKGVMNVNCVFETIPELSATKITMVASFSELPPTRAMI